MSQPDFEAIARTGVAALRSGDAAVARASFEQVAAAGRATPQLLLLLAQACDRGGDLPACHAALDRMLEADSRDLRALIMKGDLFARAGDDRASVAWYNLALGRAAGTGPHAPDLQAGVQRAAAASAAATVRFDHHLRAQLADAGTDTGTLPPRFGEALSILAGTARPHLQEPTSFYYPGLPQIAFYDSAMFPWMAAMEAAAPAMRAEVEAVLADPHGVAPYVERRADRPSQDHKLQGDPSWSAFYLWKDGELVRDNAERCPATVDALANAPIPRIAGRSPMAIYSILKPRTHIEPHHGMLNTRLICHIPLIVPPECRLRVGNHTRNVEFGKALIFDDSVEHEAWNDSDEIRAILLFEIWRPELDEDERAALTAMFEAIGNYPGSGG